MWKPDWFKSFPPCKPSYDLVRQTHECFFGFFDRQIRRHLAHLEEHKDELETTAPMDYMEAFLREKLKRDALGEKQHIFT